MARIYEKKTANPNWYLRLNDPKLQAEYEEDQREAVRLGYKNPHRKETEKESEDIGRKLYLSSSKRPYWDMEAMINTLC